MKIKFDLHGVVFEYEKKPMHPARFRRLCALAAIGLYAGMVIGVAALCGVFGLLVMALATVVVIGVGSI